MITKEVRIYCDEEKNIVDNKITKCFVSHCSSDSIIMNNFSTLIDEVCVQPNVFFNTFQENNAISAGEERSEALKNNLQQAEFMIAIITDNYLRSIICISELSSFWFMSKRVIPIIFNGENGRRTLFELLGKDIIYIDSKGKIDEAAKKLANTLIEFGIEFKDNSIAIKKFEWFLRESYQTQPKRPYIGGLKDYNNIMKYCSGAGVELFTDSGLSINQIKHYLGKYKDIFIMSTTGANIISSLSSEFIPEALKRGVNFTVLIPNMYSEFCNDVAEIEMPDDVESNCQRFANEYSNVLTNLKNSIQKAKESTETGTIGKIYFGCAFTYLRQTITLGRNEDGEAWGWMSFTLPPKRTNDKTPSLSFTGNTNITDHIAYSVYNHIEAVKQVAIKRNAYMEIADMNFQNSFRKLEKVSAEQYWKELFAIAKENMNERYDCEEELIEVAAQHPLRKNGEPATEFKARLDYAVKLYYEISQKCSVKIYVPGSLHMHKGKADIQSLSSAGKSYLIKKGVPEEDIFADEQNFAYKAEKGVYNSADECYVATQIFKNGDFKKIHCICSPNQILRKQLFYLAFGVLPLFYTVPCENMMHNLVYELFHSVPDVLLNDHTWQDDTSIKGMKTREERKPI